MKQLFLTLCVMGLGLASLQAQEKKNGPVFKFSDGVTHDFGTIPEGPEVTYYFEFTNTGNEPLIIQSASASCGCTTPEWPKQPILPGKKGKIKVVYATDRRAGPFTKQIFIQSNAISDKERFELEIKGTVKGKEDDTKKS